MEVYIQKIIRKIGDSIGILLNKEEQKIFDIKTGDIVEITIKDMSSVLFHRQKIIRKIGDSIGVILNKEEQKIFNLKTADVVEITIKKEDRKE